MFDLPELSYSYDALEPHIDAKTMEIHHSKHHAGYTNNLNKALEGVDTDNASIEEILRELDMEHKALRNNAGGYYNHKLFWEIMSPNGGGMPEGQLLDAINNSFESFDNLKEEFTKAASGQFGSGWAWLCKKEDRGLEIVATPNQDNPLMPGVSGGQPIMGLDVWEHAYYLNYQNRRPDYIEAFWNVVDWKKVSEKYEG